MRRPDKTVVVAAFIAWLTIPLLLMMLGVESRFLELEKRSPASLPSNAVSRLADSLFYTEVAAAFRDRVPLRVPALGLDAWIDLEIFGDSPNPEVLIGSDGWLFDRQSVIGVCEKPIQPRRVVANFVEISRVLRASGRRFVVVVAPNKEAIYPERLGAAGPLAHCAQEWRQEIRALLSSADLPDYIDLWGAMEGLKARANEDIYWPHDTHWTSESAIEVSRLIVEQLRPGLWDDGVVRSRPHSSPGDLASKIGLPTSIERTLYEVERDVRVKIVARKKGRLRRLSTVGKNQRRFKPNVLSIYDSFGLRYLGMLPQFLRRSTWVSWRGLPNGKLTSIIDEFVRANVVVLESVERSLASRFSGSARNVPAHLIAALLDELPRTALAPSALPDGAFDLPPAGTDSSRYVVFDIGPLVDEATALRIRAAAQDSDGTWGHVAIHVVKSPQGERRVVVRLSATARAVRIRPPKLDVGDVSLVDL